MKIRRGDILMGRVDKDTLVRITEAVQVQVGVFDKYN